MTEWLAGPEDRDISFCVCLLTGRGLSSWGLSVEVTGTQTGVGG